LHFGAEVPIIPRTVTVSVTEFPHPVQNWVFPGDTLPCVELISPYLTADFVYVNEIK